MGVIVRQSIKGTIANYFGIAIGFVTTFFVLTRYLTPEEIGLTRVLVDAAILLCSLAQLGTSSSIVRYYPFFKNQAKNDNGFFFWTVLIPLIGFAIFATIFLLLRAPIEAVFAEKSSLFVDYYYAVLPLAFCMLYMQIFESNANVLMRIVVPKITREVAVRLLTLVVYLLYAFRLVSFQHFIVLFCGVYGVATLVNVVYLFSLQRITIRPNFAYITRSLARDWSFYTLFLIATAFATAITPALSSFFISAQKGLSFTGIFAIATYIAAVIEIPYRSLGAISQPELSQKIKENRIDEADALCKKVSLHQLLAGSLILFVIWINIDLFFDILPNGDDYLVAKNVVLFLGLSRLLNSTLAIGTTVLSYSRFYYFSLIFAFVQTATAIVLNNWLIPIYGINGAAFATLLAYGIYYFGLLFVVRLKVKTSPFSLKQFWVILLVIGLFFANFCLQKIGSLVHLPNNLFINCLEAVLRTGILLLVAIFACYKMQISLEINQLIRKILRR